MIKRKAWLEHENYQLWLGHKMNTSLVVLEEYLGRSKSAINKQLDRSGIRKEVRESKKEGWKAPKLKCIEKFENLIIMCGLDNLSIGMERRHTRKWQPSNFTRAVLNSYGIESPPPWNIKCKQKKLPVKSGVGRSSKELHYIYVSAETCAHYLIRHGYDVKRYHRKNPCNWKYLINGKAVTEAGLLRQANIVRRKNNEPIFHIEGITFEE